MNNIQQQTDEHLVRDFKSGSTRAMEKIVERYENPIFAFGLKMCGQPHDAEDITQETFLSAFRYLDGFRGEAKLKNWLFKIAARACIKKRRKKKCEPDRELSLESFMHDGESPGRYDIPDWSEDPADNVLRAELKHIIDKAVTSLPPKYRMVFTLRDIEGFSTGETAEILHLTPQTVKTRLHRARLFLREEIANAYAEKKIQ